MPLIDPGDRRDHNIMLRLNAREYLVVLRALKLIKIKTFSGGVRKLVLEKAAAVSEASDVPR